MAKTVNLELDPNTTTSFELDYTDVDTDLPIDLTGYTAKVQIRLRPYSEPVLLELTDANGKILLGGPSGIIKLQFSPSDISSGTWFSGFYDLYITKTSDSSKTCVAKGLVTILKGVTQ